MTILELLQHDHEEVEQLIDRLMGDGSTNDIEARLQAVVTHNSRIDHAVFYRAVESSSEAQEAVRLYREEERAMLAALAQLHEEIPQPNDGWRGSLRTLRALVGRHAAREAAIFPWARQVLAGAALEELFAEAERRKNRQSVTDGLIFPAHRFGIE